MQQWLKKFEESEGGIDKFTKGYEYYGIHVLDDNTVVAREWAPGAVDVYLTGDFSELN
jgi:1,4-alpha-glucan branching enzyme